MSLYNTSGFDNVTNLVDVAVTLNNSFGQPFLIGNLVLVSFFLLMSMFIRPWEIDRNSLVTRSKMEITATNKVMSHGSIGKIIC